MAVQTENATLSRTRLRPSVAERVEALREMAEHDPVNAQDAAWGWFSRLSELALEDRDRAVEQLDRIFGEGSVPAPIEGETDGMMITYLFGQPYEFAMRKAVALWKPWLGKRFYPEQQRGENRLAEGFRVVSRAIWPRYATHRNHGERVGFGFETRIDRSELEPRIPVLTIDYESDPSNPRRIVASIRDELVTIVPDTHLGRWLWREPNGTWRNIAYFALRQDVSDRG